MLDDIQAIRDFLLRHTEILRGRGAIASTTTGVFIPAVSFMFGNGAGRINDICITKYDKSFSSCTSIIYRDVYARNNDICLHHPEPCGGRHIVHLQFSQFSLHSFEAPV